MAAYSDIFRFTRLACYVGYITQAIVNNLSPLLFLIYQSSLGISMQQVTLLITVNFGVQLFVDLVFAKLADKIGYRICLIGAHVCAAVGLAGLMLFPRLLPSFAGLITATVLMAIGGGLIEVLVSPTVEACPSPNKEKQMSLLHSFYCWGSAAVVALSTGFLAAFGSLDWGILCLIWACVPLLNAIFFGFVPVPSPAAEGESMPVKKLVLSPVFWLFVALMALSGAAEQSMSQWASTFAESSLGVPKAVGDMLGPCLFAILMGTARILYAKFGKRLRLCLILSASLAVLCYLAAWLSPVPALSLAGCALCGFAVGILWPGTFSNASRTLPKGGTAMFALLALAGDLGGTLGPTVVGACASALGELQLGLAFGLAFPALFVILMLLFTKKEPQEGKQLENPKP